MHKNLTINLHKLQVNTRLGFGEGERSKLQTITCDLSITMPKLPESANDDHSPDYICYAKLAKLIVKHCKNREFRLLEYLCNELYKLLKDKVPKGCKLYIKITKLHPAMNYHADSASCEIKDE